MTRLAILSLFCIYQLTSDAQSISRYSIIITEIMADPAPQVGLPNHEWVEIKNITTNTIDLKNFRIADAGSLGSMLPAYQLQPDSMVIVCSNSAITSLSVYGPAIGVSNFPSLNNDGDLVYLISPGNTIIHAVEFSSAWYGNELKKQGGWSLEMMDTDKPCIGTTNWRASTDLKGGTPGKINSVNSIVPDRDGPYVTHSYAPDANSIYITLNEPADSASAVNTSNYQVHPAILVSKAETEPYLFNQIKLTLSQPLQKGTIYKLTVKNLRDCLGTVMQPQEVKTGLAELPEPGDLAINEILFNPRPNGYDYVEILNRGSKILDASNLYLANRNSAGQPASIKQLSNSPFIIFPGDHIVITEDSNSLQVNYLVKNPGHVIQLNAMPSFPDDKGSVLLLNTQGTVIDAVNYHKDWHFKLIDNQQGVALERINPEAPAQQAANWQSAASTAGYGTPTYVNSQYLQSATPDLQIQIAPTLFSPDNDGHDDFLMVHYNVNEPSYTANITIFNIAGIPVKKLVRNGTMAYTGSWKWDGLNDNNQQLPVGQYIIFSELFNLKGKKKQFKHVVVLARRY